MLLCQPESQLKGIEGPVSASSLLGLYFILAAQSVPTAAALGHLVMEREGGERQRECEQEQDRSPETFVSSAFIAHSRACMKKRTIPNVYKVPERPQGLGSHTGHLIYNSNKALLVTAATQPSPKP